MSAGPIASPPLRLPRSVSVPRPGAEALFGGAVALVLTAIGLRAGGGLQLGPTTTAEMVLQLGGGVLAAGALLDVRRRGAPGAVTLALFGVLAAITALSILWAIHPSDAWLETNRTLAYFAVFATGLVLARSAGAWWGGLLAGVAAAATIVSLYALATKVFPSALSEDEIYARLREPYGYWNAVGLTAALGLVPCLWLGARRHGHAARSALAYPATGILVLTILLAYSRGSLLAAAAGAAVWFAVVPLRLRGVTVLAAGAAGAFAVAAWTFAQEPLTQDRVELGLRNSAGHELGVAIVAMVLVLLAVGLAVGFAAARRSPAPETRRRAGTAILVALALVPVAFMGALAFSERGLGGSLSKGWTSLTDPDAATPPNEPGRLTAVGSVRARYWNEALKIFKANKLTGVGAGGYATARPRYRNDDLDVRHAHGYVVQTAADLGLIGLAASLALLAAWLAAAARTTGLGRRRRWVPRPFTPERIALLTLLATVVVFAVHSFVDWTWFTPGTAVPAMLVAGWVAGRGPYTDSAQEPAGLRRSMRQGVRVPWRAAAAAGVLAAALLAAWATWQPKRSVDAGNDALAALDRASGNPQALERARQLALTARDRNPLSIEPLFELQAVETVAGRSAQAREALEDAVRLQPSNPATWLRLADFALHQGNDPREALRLLGPGLHLDPRSDFGAALYLEASRAAAGAPAPGAGTPAAPATPPSATP